MSELAPLPGCILLNLATGDIASLSHRLLSGIPPGWLDMPFNRFKLADCLVVVMVTAPLFAKAIFPTRAEWARWE